MKHSKITLDKEYYTKEEVEEIVHKVKCNMLIEEMIRNERDHEEFKKSTEDIYVI